MNLLCTKQGKLKGKYQLIDTQSEILKKETIPEKQK